MSLAKYTAKNNFESVSTTGRMSTKGCNSITFRNQGDVTFYINRVFRLIPGESFSLNQEVVDVEDWTEYEVRFDLLHPASYGNDQNCMVVTTFLQDIKFSACNV